METINKRKRREPLYQAAEKELLVDLVEQNYAVVENKKTDAVSSRTKTERWKTMADQFNATSSVHFRDWLVLRTLWENMKKKAKIVIALQHDNLYATGGGKANRILQDPIISRVITLIRPQVEALSNEFDSDHLDITTPRDVSFVTIVDRDEDNIIEDQDVGDLSSMERNAANDWSHYNPSMLKAPPAPALRTNHNLEVSGKVIDNEDDMFDLPSVSHQQMQFISSNENSGNTKLNLNLSKNANQMLRQSVVADSSRRRPVLRRPQTEALVEAKLCTLTSATQEATKEHAISVQILEIQLEHEKVKLEVEKEKLVQEKLKTEILRFDLDKKIGDMVEYTIQK